MSALWAPSWREEQNQGAEASVRHKLRSVPEAPPKLARFPFLLVLIGIFVFGMASLLMLNTALQNQAFEARRLERQETALAYDQAALETQLDVLSSSPELARRASAMGMRPNPKPAFLVVPDGRVIGKATPVTGDEVPELIVKTPAELAAEKAAAEAKKRADAAAAAEKEKARIAAEKAEEAAKKAEEAAKKAAAEARKKADEAKAKADAAKKGGRN